MGIWIRSQSKRILVKAECVEVSREYIYASTITYNSESGSAQYDVGKYESEEEAMAVMDKIQEFIKTGTRGSMQRESGSGWNGIEKYGEIFQMPPKGFLIEKAPA